MKLEFTDSKELTPSIKSDMVAHGITDPTKMVEAANNMIRERLSDSQQAMLAEIALLLIPVQPKSPISPFRFSANAIPHADALLLMCSYNITEPSEVIEVANKLLDNLPAGISSSVVDRATASKAVEKYLPAYLGSSPKYFKFTDIAEIDAVMKTKLAIRGITDHDTMLMTLNKVLDGIPDAEKLTMHGASSALELVNKYLDVYWATKT